MFQSFFPKPKLFFISFVLWSALAVGLWYGGAGDFGQTLFGAYPEDSILGMGHFTTPDFIWFYIYYAVATALFAAFWFWKNPHPWQLWSILGTALILFATYINVQLQVALNNWYRPFFDAIQQALGENSTVTRGDFYSLLWVFAALALFFIVINVSLRYLVQHWIFRWRTAMNDYYMGMWQKVRHIEGASQRVQEDTMRFAGIMEGLGVAAVDSVMTLIAFLPLLWGLSQYVPEIPIFGAVPQALVWAAILWSLFGTVLLMGAGIRLPGLEFKNQRVEAAYRKELVYGEDDANRAQPPVVRDLFGNVRHNYFRLYLEYLYFNVVRYFYINIDSIFVLILLIPAFIAGPAIGLTFGIFQQIRSAFSQVSNSFQYLVNSWTTVVELLSIYKRLKAFEAAIQDLDLPDIDREWLEIHGAPARDDQVEMLGPRV